MEFRSQDTGTAILLGRQLLLWLRGGGKGNFNDFMTWLKDTDEEFYNLVMDIKGEENVWRQG
jgi:hypothetical protein